MASIVVLVSAALSPLTASPAQSLPDCGASVSVAPCLHRHGTQSFVCMNYVPGNVHAPQVFESDLGGPCHHLSGAEATCSVNGDRVACLRDYEDFGSTYSQLCLYTDIAGVVAPWYSGTVAGCAWTVSWSFVPGYGVCAETLDGAEDRSDKLLCINSGWGGSNDPSALPCFMWMPFIAVCDDPDT